MVPVCYWIVSTVLLIWNAIGCAACIGQLTASPDKIAKLPEARRDAWLAMPATAKLAYAIAVGAGLVGSAALLVRSLAAGPLFVASLLGVIVQFGWFFLVYRGASRSGGGSAIFPAAIAAIAVAEVGFACWAKTEGLLS